MEQISKESFNEIVKSGRVLVDFNAKWCGPCNMLRPILEEIDGDIIKVVSVDVDSNEDLAREFAVMSIPTLILFEDGNIKKQNVGFMNKDDLINWLNN